MINRSCVFLYVIWDIVRYCARKHYPGDTFIPVLRCNPDDHNAVIPDAGMAAPDKRATSITVSIPNLPVLFSDVRPHANERILRQVSDPLLQV